MQPPDDLALFRFEVIAPLLNLEGPRGTLKRAIAKLAERHFDHPQRGRVQLGQGTIEEWLYLYRRGGLDALKPCPRQDRGHSRRIDDEVADRIEELARAATPLDGPGILKELNADSLLAGRVPSLSTLYRFLKARGLDLSQRPAARDHRAFEFDLAGDCWQVDVMYGPHLPTPSGMRRRTYLIAILDDATRVIAHAQFYWEQHLSTLKDALKQAFLKRGIPRRLYADQGRIFKSRQLLQLAAGLGIHLLHTRPYRPQGRAKLERWFGTARRSFLRRIDLDRLTGLDELNRLLFAFVEGEYHLRPHRGIGGETPLDRWVRLGEGIRPLPPDVDLDALFLSQTTRRVRKDGTITLDGKSFEVGPLLIGQKITVAFDPFDLRVLRVRSERGEETAAFPVDLVGNRRVARHPDPERRPTRPKLRSLEARAQELAQETSDD